MKDLSDEATLCLIAPVEEFPQLWCLQNNQYRNNGIKSELWKQIANEMQRRYSQYGAYTEVRNKITYRRENLVVIQKTVKMHLVKKKYRPRYRCMMKLRALLKQVQQMSNLASQLKKDGQQSKVEIQALEGRINTAMKRIKDGALKNPEMEKEHNTLILAATELMNALNQRIQLQKVAEEQARMRRVQQEMELARKRKEEEERQRREEEEHRQRKIQMEAARKAEERAKELEDAKLAKAMKEKLVIDHREELLRNQQMEQESRDHELALRLAQENNSVVEDVGTPVLPVRSQVRGAKAEGKFDLSKWKYSELRDVINTSCDLELLAACREEFHRRLKVYHAWKSKNAKKGSGDTSQNRVPTTLQNGGALPGGQGDAVDGEDGRQRYFRIPFRKDGSSSGLWFAHFDGQYIARQMELHPGRPPVLLLADKEKKEHVSVETCSFSSLSSSVNTSVSDFPQKCLIYTSSLRPYVLFKVSAGQSLDRPGYSPELEAKLATYVAEMRNRSPPVTRDAITERVGEMRLVRLFAKCEISLDGANDVVWERSSDDDGNDGTVADKS
ncbi:unconventional myosin-VI isoform X2 [Ixodes scapularis]